MGSRSEPSAIPARVGAIGSLQLRGLYTYKDAGGELRKRVILRLRSLYLHDTAPLVKGRRWAPPNAMSGAPTRRYLKEIRSQGGVRFSFTGDAMSLYDNRVELDPVMKDPWGIPVAKTFYKHDKWDLDMSKFALDRSGKRS